MQIGSLIECTEEIGHQLLDIYRCLPKKGEIYVCRGIWVHTMNGQAYHVVYIQEYINQKYDHYGRDIEIPYPAKWFREVQPPIDIYEYINDELPQYFTNPQNH